MAIPTPTNDRMWARSLQRTDQPKLARERVIHRYVKEPQSPNVLKQLPDGLAERITKVLMAQGYREMAKADRALAENDMAAGFETLPD